MPSLREMGKFEVWLRHKSKVVAETIKAAFPEASGKHHVPIDCHPNKPTHLSQKSLCLSRSSTTTSVSLPLRIKFSAMEHPEAAAATHSAAPTVPLPPPPPADTNTVCSIAPLEEKRGSCKLVGGFKILGQSFSGIRSRTYLLFSSERISSGLSLVHT